MREIFPCYIHTYFFWLITVKFPRHGTFSLFRKANNGIKTALAVYTFNS